jgi:hypothetical protein
VLGIDQLRTREVKNTHALVLKHIAAVRRIRNLEQATIVFCLESNLAFEAQHILHACERSGLKRWVALQEGAGNTLGWLTVRRARQLLCPQRA